MVDVSCGHHRRCLRFLRYQLPNGPDEYDNDCFAGKEDNNPLINRIKGLSIINEMSLLVGLALMAIGTFLGAVWANESWGRYWGWDPKETWALITMVIYAIVTHLHLIKRCNSLWLFNVTSVIAFSSVLMTFLELTIS